MASASAPSFDGAAHEPLEVLAGPELDRFDPPLPRLVGELERSALPPPDFGFKNSTGRCGAAALGR